MQDLSSPVWLLKGGLQELWGGESGGGVALSHDQADCRGMGGTLDQEATCKTVISLQDLMLLPLLRVPGFQ